MQNLSGATNLQLLSLYAFPLKHQGTEECQRGARNRQNEAPRHRNVVCGQDTGQLALRRYFSDVSSAGSNNFCGIYTYSVPRNFLNQRTGEYVLSNGNGCGAAQGVGEDGNSVTGGYVFLIEHDLDRHEWYLDTGAGTNTGQNLVPNPHLSRGGGFQGVKHSRAGREDGCARPGKRGIPAKCGDASTNGDRRYGDA